LEEATPLVQHNLGLGRCLNLRKELHNFKCCAIYFAR